MKYIILITIFCFLLGSSYADTYWIVNQDNQVIAKTKYEPNVKDLESRSEIAIRKDLDIPLRKAEYRGNKIVEHVKTKSEIEAEQIKAEKQEEMRTINEEIRKKNQLEALKELKASGKTFKHIKEKDFE